MFALGILSLLQITFLPGHLLLRILRLRPGGMAELLVSLPLSLVVNHFLVVALVLVRCYVPAAMYTVIAVEVLAIALLRWRRGAVDEPEGSSDLRRVSLLADAIRRTGAARAVVWWALLWLAAAILLVHSAAAVQNVGTVFETWDAVVSWNRWATSWANNAFPSLTWRYPQLLPSNVSIGYVVLGGTSIQLFVKAAMAVFPLAQLLMLGDLAVRRRNPAYLAALSLVGLMNLLTVRDQLTSGYADVPVAYMITASLYLLVLAEDAAQPRERLRVLLLSVVVAAGAALTKQAGLLWAAAAPIIAALEWRRVQASVAPSAPLVRPRSVLASVALFAAISLALFGPWYAYRAREIRAGRDVDESSLVTAASGRHDYGERVRFVYERLKNEASRTIVPLLPLALLGALTSSRWRWPVLLYALPYMAICAGLVGYDLRNFASAWPVLFTSGAAGWVELLARRRAFAVPGSTSPRSGRVPGALVGGILAAATTLALLEQYTSDSVLARLQLRRQRQIGFPALNDAIYEYHAGHRLDGMVVTDYQPFQYLPEVGPRYVFDDFHDVERLRRVVAAPENRYLLVPMPFLMTTRPAVLQYVESELAAGRFRLVVESFGYRLIEITGRKGA